MTYNSCPIVSFLDLPDLAALAHVNRQLASLTADPVLHRMRLRVITPSRVDHSLFGRSPQGNLLRPTLQELVQRGVMRGLHIERRSRTGGYLYSSHWSIQKDRMARIIRGSMCGMMASGIDPKGASHSQSRPVHGLSIFGESERVRLALCPDITKMIQFYEKMTD
ncbi:hypothetical protein EDC04DRAFT_2864062 [Pisolithus marmoratus]|nr:hypothetical protein EDC04DRAFT_2864062 [Pisolithus marmoratus]